MNLTDLAVHARDAAAAQAEASRQLSRERAIQNDRARVKDLFRTLLGIDVDDSDLIRTGDSHAVIVDGVALALPAPDHLPKDEAPYLSPTVVDGDEAHSVDASLSVHGSKIRSLETLGRLLDPSCRHSVT